MDPELHVTCVIGDNGVRMRGSVVEEQDDLVHGGSGGSVLFRGEDIDGEEYGVIHGPSEEKQGTKNFLDAGALGFGQGGSFIRWQGKLDLFAIGGRCPRVGRILGFRGERMLEALEGLLNAPGHGKFTGTALIIPDHMHT